MVEVTDKRELNKIRGQEIVDPFEIKNGQELVICGAEKCFHGTAKVFRRSWRSQKEIEMDSAIRPVNVPYYHGIGEYLVITLIYEESGLQDTYYKSFYIPLVYETIAEQGDLFVYPPNFKIYKRAYGTSVVDVGQAKKLPPIVDVKVAEMLTGKAPKTYPPARAGTKTRRAKGRKYRKRAGRLLTRQARSWSSSR